MSTSLLDQLRDYGEHFEAGLPSMEFDEIAARSIPLLGPRSVRPRPVWVAAAAAASVIVVAVGLVALLAPLAGDEPIPVVVNPTIPLQPIEGLPDAAAPRPIDITSGVTVAPDGTLWAATGAGIVRWDLSTGTPTVYPATDLPTGGDHPSGIVAAPDGTIWVSTWAPQRILRFDGSAWSPADAFENLAVVNPPCIPDEECRQSITAMAVGADNVLWVAVGPETLVRYNGADWEAIEVPAESQASDGVLAWASSLTVAPDGTLWAAGGEEVASFDGTSWTRYSAGDGLPGGGIWSIAVTPDGTVWAGAVSDEVLGTAGGLSRREGNGWSTLTEQDGLFSNDIRSLAVADDGTLWAVHASASDGTPLPGTYRAGGALSRLEGDIWTTVSLDEVGGGFGWGSAVDEYGAMWVASRWGVVGYNGHEAIRLRVAESMVPIRLDETPLSDSSVLAISGSILTDRPAGPVPPVATCPSGSHPDQPGPVDQARPPTMSLPSAVIDEQSGVMVALADTARNGSRTWTFDLCTNTWQRMEPEREPPDDYPTMIYDRDSDRTLAVGFDSVWSYDVETDAWTEHGRPPQSARYHLAYHDSSGLVVAHTVDSFSRTYDLDLWAYDLDTDTWTSIAQSSPLEVGGSSSPLLVYDPSVDRFVVYMGDNCSGFGPYDGCGSEQTWIFDQHTGTWSREDTVTPEVPLGYGAFGGESTFDESTQRVVVFNFGILIAHDARAQEWEVVSDRGPFSRSGHVIAFDPVNQRLVMTGGEARVLSEMPYWEARNDVYAFNTRTGEWITLLDQTGEQ